MIYTGLNWTVCIVKTVLNALFLYCGYLGRTPQTHKDIQTSKGH
jgi:hypothetical protein